MFTSKLWEKCRFQWVEMQVIVLDECYVWVSVLNRKTLETCLRIFFFAIPFPISRIGRTKRYMLFVTLVRPKSWDRKTPPQPQQSLCRASIIQYVGLIVSLSFLHCLGRTQLLSLHHAKPFARLFFMIINHLKRYFVWN